MDFHPVKNPVHLFVIMLVTSSEKLDDQSVIARLLQVPVEIPTVEIEALRIFGTSYEI